MLLLAKVQGKIFGYEMRWVSAVVQLANTSVQAPAGNTIQLVGAALLLLKIGIGDSLIIKHLV